jgi:hypothetical protein
MSKKKLLGILSPLTFDHFSKSLENGSKFEMKVYKENKPWLMRITGMKIRTESNNLGEAYDFEGIRVLNENSFQTVQGWYDFSIVSEVKGMIREK